jgi:hypothetical protein
MSAGVKLEWPRLIWGTGLRHVSVNLSTYRQKIRAEKGPFSRQEGGVPRV